MSQCKNDTPGPLTTVSGFIKDYKTGEAFGNVKLQVIRESGGFSAHYDEYDTVSTRSDGTFSLTFTPIGNGTFSLNIVNNQQRFIYNYSTSNEIKLGKTDTMNFRVQKLINLALHYISNSSHGKNNLNFGVSSCCYVKDFPVLGGLSFQNQTIVDYTYQRKMPQLSTITISSLYYSTLGTSGPNTGLPIDGIGLSTTFNSSKNDTTVTVINP